MCVLFVLVVVWYIVCTVVCVGVQLKLSCMCVYIYIYIHIYVVLVHLRECLVWVQSRSGHSLQEEVPSQPSKCPE